MANASIAFKKLDGVLPEQMRKVKVRPGYEHIDVHIIFYIHMDGDLR